MTNRSTSRMLIGGLAVIGAVALAAADQPRSGGSDDDARLSAASSASVAIPRPKPPVPPEFKSKRDESGQWRAAASQSSASARSSASAHSSSSSSATVRSSSSSRARVTGGTECEVDAEATVVENGVSRTVRQRQTRTGGPGEDACSANAEIRSGEGTEDREQE